MLPKLAKTFRKTRANWRRPKAAHMKSSVLLLDDGGYRD